MMRHRIKQGIFMGGVMLLFPGSVFAVPLLDIGKIDVVQLSTGTFPAKNTESFCTDFPKTAEEIKATLKPQAEAVEDYLKENENTLSEARNVADAKLGEARSQSDQRRSEWYTRLDARAETDNEKDAVVQFQQTLEKALEKRRETVDAAVLTFRVGVDALATERRASMKLAKEDFRKAVESALSQVDAHCATGKTTAEIEKSLKTDLKTARLKLKLDGKHLEKILKAERSLEDTTNKSFDTVKADFEKNMNEAREALLLSFEQ